MKGATFISVDTILSNVLPMVADSEMEINPRGFYVSAVQQAMEGLALDSFFDERNEPFEVPKDLVMPMPEGSFNIKNIWLFNGTECNIGLSKKVYWARNYYTRGAGSLKNDKYYNGTDPFYDSHSSLVGRNPNKETIRYNQQGRNNLYYYNIQAGMIMFSPTCLNFEKVMLNYHGTGTAIGEQPIIPLIFRKAIEDYCTEFILRVNMAKEPQRWAGLWKVYDARLRDPDGEWEKSLYKVKTMHSSQREELKEYLSRGGW